MWVAQGDSCGRTTAGVCVDVRDLCCHQGRGDAGGSGQPPEITLESEGLAVAGPY